MAKIINCKEIRDKLYEDIKQRPKPAHSSPKLVVISVGDDAASKVYIRNKEKACNELGFDFLHKHHEFITTTELIKEITALNNDATVTGIIVQLPLPHYIITQNVLDAISPDKDVDALSNTCMGMICTDKFVTPSCTPGGIMTILKESGIDLCGKHCVIINRSNIVGKPLAMLMLKEDATVTVCHSKTQNLKDICRTADIVVVGVGKPNFLTADMVKEGAVVIDVGINRLEDGKITGDVDFREVSEKASYITTVPGGVGVMTVATLMDNIYWHAVNASLTNRIKEIINAD